MANKQFKLIFSPQLAQFLLHSGFVIEEIKPKRGAINETVFVFRYEKGFDEQVTAWLNEKEN